MTTVGRRALDALVAVGRTAMFTALSLGAAIGIWLALLKIFNLNPYFAKSPRDVWDLLFTGDSAGEERSVLFGALWTTLRDAALGLVSGTIAAIAVAIGVVLRRGFSQTVMPVAIALRSVPLVAMTPLITLVFGDGLFTVALISGIVTFFPTLVNLVQGLRSVPAQSFDLFHAYGARETAVLRRLQIPYAVPSLFTAARIAAPGALLGAILAEWLATGKGLGYIMVTSSSESQYSLLWASIVTITVVSVLVYNVVGVVERVVAERFGTSRSPAEASKGTETMGTKVNEVRRITRHLREGNQPVTQPPYLADMTPTANPKASHVARLVPVRRTTRRTRIIAALLAFPSLFGTAAVAATATPAAAAVKPISYQLGWITNTEFAGTYIAQKDGYFSSGGLSVNLLPGGSDPVEPVVASGKALVGDSNADTVAAAVAAGANLRIIGARYQLNPFCIISSAKDPIKTPQDLIGKKIGINTYNLTAWNVFLALNHIKPSQVTTVDEGYSSGPTPLVNGQVDAWMGFSTNEPAC